MRWLFALLFGCLVGAKADYFIEEEEEEPPEPVFVRAGANVSLPCSPNEGPIRTLTWWKDYRKIVEVHDEQTVLWEAEPHVNLLSDALYLQNVVYADSADYQCQINDEQRASLRLLVQDVPDPPGMPLIMSFTSRSVNLSWAPSIDNHHSSIIHYIIHVRVGESGEWEESNGILTSDNRTSWQVIGLQPYTVYSFRVVAVNTIGSSKPSKESYYMVTLREVPDGKPNITYAHNTSSSSIIIQWAPPPKHSLHGEFLGYRITYRLRERARGEREIILRDPLARDYVIRGLNAFSQYLVSLQVFNPAGRGPATTVAVMTDEGAPSRPRNLTATRITNNSVKLKWLEPEHANGIIQGYNIYHLDVGPNHTERKKVLNPQQVMEYVLGSLKAYTQYKVWVKAYTGKNEGFASNSLEIITDVQSPSEPIITNLTCQSLDSIYIEWNRPKVVYHRIDYYFISYRSENTWDFEEISLSSSQERPSHSMIISNLTSNLMYEVKVQGASRSVVEHSKLYKGPYSELKKIFLQSMTASSLEEATISAGIIAGIVCVTLVLLLAVMAFVLWRFLCFRKYFQAAYYYLDDPPRKRVTSENSKTFGDNDSNPIDVTAWPDHVCSLHADGDIGFSKEYETIQQATDLELSSECSQLMENKNKNRYVNIVAYDHSRVILKILPGQKKTTDYINANYIDGYNEPNAYIGTQGPLPSTFDDYWRMIWEQKVYIIIMITNLVERGRRKCDMYWPKEGSEIYGIVQVKLTQEIELATYTIRTLVIRNLKVKKKTSSERTVYQYHYTNWPDHGVPEHPLPVLSFIRKSATANPPGGGPIIVHCSAGVGRTGTYIVIDAMLRQIKHKQSLSVPGFLKHIRQQRNFLVQTEEQYIFIHDALLEAIESGETEIAAPEFSQYVQKLKLTTNENEKETSLLLEKQFKLVTCFKAKDFSIISATKSCNRSKNRNSNIIPVESYRVHITPKPGKDGSDYINASFFQGFNKLNEFIITQHPTMDTIADFWQMVWDHNCQTIVLLSDVDEKEYPCFWPDDEKENDYGTFKVKISEECTQDCYVTRDFILQSMQDDYEVICRVVQCSGWPKNCSPISSIYDLVHLVQDWHLEYQNGPMVVVDKFGGTEAATFCCLNTLQKQLEFENSVDVYMYTKLYHMRRPGIWQTKDDYYFLYHAVDKGLLANYEVIPALNSPVTNGHVLPLKEDSAI
ncbi:putative receptor-type tyrosine-protein phosphatase mosPTP-1 isoform X2 [Parasteatoda tepidariorum]|uniref:putative receptor-type tyrosine-protein phosphatase mosPTP-1 isoform X2 n=1 Tax=Parasteatoda tepidariorum TaxID=114398 RepID=UPI00077FB5B0|nr:tyrosine-protein phosphatase 99A isoform X2 [Parasteatoda tepidariorum]